jgi:hypothetical protein
MKRSREFEKHQKRIENERPIFPDSTDYSLERAACFCLFVLALIALWIFTR